MNTTRSNNFTFRNEEFIVYLAGIVSLLVPMRILRLSFQFLRQTTMTNRALRDPISSYFFFLSKKEDWKEKNGSLSHWIRWDGVHVQRVHVQSRIESYVQSMLLLKFHWIVRVHLLKAISRALLHLLSKKTFIKMKQKSTEAKFLFAINNL